MTETSAAPQRAVPGLDALRRMERRRPGQECIDRTVSARATSARPSLLRRVSGGSPIGEAERASFDAARGERIVGRELDALPSDWIVLHSLSVLDASGPLDHVVVGPPGLFALTTRFVAGDRAVVADDYLLVHGERKPFGRTAVSAVRRTAHLAGRSLPPSVVVRGVVVVAGARVVRRGSRTRPVEVCDARFLRSWLESLPPVLDSGSVERIAVQIAGAVEAATGGEAPADRTAAGSVRASLFARLEWEAVVARRIRSLWRAAGFVAAAAAVWVSFTQLPAWLALTLG